MKLFIRGIRAIVILLFVAAYVQARSENLHYSTQVNLGFGLVAQASQKGKVGEVCFSGSMRIACLNAKTGDVIWSENGPGFLSTGPGVGPVIVGSTLVYMASGGFFIAYGLDLDSGKLKWKLAKKSPALAVGPGAVFLSTQGGLGIIAIDPKSGKIKWKRRAVPIGGTLKHIVYSNSLLYTDSPEVWDSRSGHVIRKLAVDPDVVIANKGRVFMSGDGIPLIALNARSGRPLWKTPNPFPSLRAVPEDVFLAATSKYVIAVFYKGEAGWSAHKAVVQVRDSENGRLLWKKIVTSDVPLLYQPVSVDNGAVYLIEPSEDRGAKLIAFETLTGKQLWTYSDSHGFFGPAVSVDGTIFFTDGGDYGSGARATLYALNSATGALRWKYTLSLGKL